MAAATVLEAVPELDSVQLQFLDTFKAGQGRNYSYMFNFEQEFEHSVVRIWMEDNWRPVCAWASGIYLLLIFGGQSVMASRPPFQLRGPLTAWNMFLAVFSIMGAARTLPEFIYTFSTLGFYHSLCVPSFIVRDRVSGFWTWMFVMSKVPELGDTIFIVLRKQRLIFLHWYHHVTVLIYCWYSFSEYTAPARWFVVMNFVVHSLMYTYYAFKALRFRIPKCVAMVITSLQLLQMIVGCVVNYTAFTFKRRGVKCGVSDTNLQLSLLMYTSYFVLFARFFYNTYFNTGEKGNEEIKKSHIQKAIQKDSTLHLNNKEVETDCTNCTNCTNKPMPEEEQNNEELGQQNGDQKEIVREESLGTNALPMEENSKTQGNNYVQAEDKKITLRDEATSKEMSDNLENQEDEEEMSKIQNQTYIHTEETEEAQSAKK